MPRPNHHASVVAPDGNGIRTLPGRTLGLDFGSMFLFLSLRFSKEMATGRGGMNGRVFFLGHLSHGVM